MAKVNSKAAGASGNVAAKDAGKKSGGPAKPTRPTKAAPSAKAPADARSKTDEHVTAPSPADKAESGGTPRAGSKLAIVLAMLREDCGASIAAIMHATGWLSHTTRAVLTGLKKRGFVIERQAGDKDSPSVYRIRAEASDQTSASALGKASGASSPAVTAESSGHRSTKRAA